MRQPARDLAERARDRGDAVEVKRRLQHRGDDHRDHRAWHSRAARNARSIDDEQQTQQSEQGGCGMQRRQGLQQVPELFVKVRAAAARQAEEVLPLTDPDDDADAGREACNHGIGDEAQHAAELRGAEQNQDDSRHAGGEQQAIHAMLRGDAGKDHDERSGRSGDLDAAAAAQRNHDTGDDCGVDALLGLDAGRDRERHCKRQGDDADDDACDEVACPMIAAEKSCLGGF
jgi:hypothetical protein